MDNLAWAWFVGCACLFAYGFWHGMAGRINIQLSNLYAYLGVRAWQSHAIPSCSFRKIGIRLDYQEKLLRVGKSRPKAFIHVTMLHSLLGHFVIENCAHLHPINQNRSKVWLKSHPIVFPLSIKCCCTIIQRIINQSFSKAHWWNPNFFENISLSSPITLVTSTETFSACITFAPLQHTSSFSHLPKFHQHQKLLRKSFVTIPKNMIYLGEIKCCSQKVTNLSLYLRNNR